MKRPWFKIIAIEPRPVSEIAREVCDEFGISVEQIKGARRYREIVDARVEAYRRIYRERPDLSSGQVASFFRVDGSVIRHFWRDVRAGEAA